MRTRCGVVAVVAVALTASGCSGIGSTGLEEALGHASTGDLTAQSIDYGDLAQIRAAVGDDVLADKRYRHIAGFGASPLLRNWVPSAENEPEPLGIDPLSADRMLVVAGLGQDGPETAGVLFDGIDVDAVESELEAAGAKPTDVDGGTAWKLDPDGDQWPGRASNLRTVGTAGGEVAYATSSDALGLVLSPEEPLAGKEPYKALAGCLGDVTAAQLRTQETLEQLQLAGIGAGVRAADPEQIVEVLCLEMTSEAAARRAAKAARQDERFSEETGTRRHRVEVDGTMVSIEALPAADDDMVGRFILYLGDYRALGFLNRAMR